MRRIPLSLGLACLALCIASCAGVGGSGPSTPSSTAITALGGTVVDEQALKTAYNALDVAATCADALLALKQVAPGSPKAIAIAHGLKSVRSYLDAANAARKVANAPSAAAAFAAAEAGLADLTKALTAK